MRATHPSALARATPRPTDGDDDGDGPRGHAALLSSVALIARGRRAGREIYSRWRFTAYMPALTTFICGRAVISFCTVHSMRGVARGESSQRLRSVVGGAWHVAPRRRPAACSIVLLVVGPKNHTPYTHVTMAFTKAFALPCKVLDLCRIY